MPKMTVTPESIKDDAVVFSQGWGQALNDTWNAHLLSLSLTKVDVGTCTENQIRFWTDYIQTVNQLDRYIGAERWEGDVLVKNQDGGMAAFHAFFHALWLSGQAYETACESVKAIIGGLEGHS
jgi:hypothetical protein